MFKPHVNWWWWCWSNYWVAQLDYHLYFNIQRTQGNIGEQCAKAEPALQGSHMWGWSTLGRECLASQLKSGFTLSLNVSEVSVIILTTHVHNPCKGDLHISLKNQFWHLRLSFIICFTKSVCALILPWCDQQCADSAGTPNLRSPGGSYQQFIIDFENNY